MREVSIGEYSACLSDIRTDGRSASEQLAPDLPTEILVGELCNDPNNAESELKRALRQITLKT